MLYLVWQQKYFSCLQCSKGRITRVADCRIRSNCAVPPIHMGSCFVSTGPKSLPPASGVSSPPIWWGPTTETCSATPCTRWSSARGPRCNTWSSTWSSSSRLSTADGPASWWGPDRYDTTSSTRFRCRAIEDPEQWQAAGSRSPHRSRPQNFSINK
jgi:hypothetical protein